VGVWVGGRLDEVPPTSWKESWLTLLESGDFAFETADASLIFLNRMKGPPEAFHPPGQALLFGSQAGAAVE
jgi:hypothetical protein